MNEKKLRILLAEGDPGETATGLRKIYSEGQDGLELTMVSAVSTLIHWPNPMRLTRCAACTGRRLACP